MHIILKLNEEILGTLFNTCIEVLNSESTQYMYMFWHAVWKSCGSPNIGIVADLRRRTRALYHKAVKQCKRHKDKMVSESMAQSLHNSNYTEFWNTIKKHTCLKSIVHSSKINCTLVYR